MDTENTRVTIAQAAELAGVSERTINRWRAQGRIQVWYPHGPWKAAEYDPREVLAAANRTAELTALLETGNEDTSP
jgi:predicted site-specific integrase-resolvase